MSDSATTIETKTLYDRLGGGEGLRAIISDIVDTHLANDTIRSRFEPFDRETMVEGAFSFFAMGTGGPQNYTGRGLRAVHTGMNITEQEFVVATDDLLAVLTRHGIGEREQQEVLAAFWSMKGEVLRL